MSNNKHTLGQAIDQILNALEPLNETARRTALSAVCMQLEIITGELGAPALENRAPAFILPTQHTEITTAATPQSALPSPQATPIDIRTFKEQKKPTSARQMACIVAFYLKELLPEAERKETINTADLEKYFKQAGFKLPAKIPQVLIDAKGAGYFENAARGEYKLNAVGYNLVAHNLPSSTE